MAVDESTEAQADLKTAHVKLVGNVAFLDKDFVLWFKTRPRSGSEEPLACMEVHPSLPNHRALMITLPPSFMLQHLAANDSGEIILLADCSGSMNNKVDGLKSAMERFIEGIPRSRFFNIWCFGSSYTSLWNRSRQWSNQTMSEALSYVRNKLGPNMGGTNLLPAFQAIMDVWKRSKAADGIIDIIVVTDGEVWQHYETIEFVSSARRSSEGRARFFALGIGNAVSHEIIEGIAKAGRGYAEIIPIGNRERWEGRMSAVLSAALTGHASTIQVELDGDLASAATAQPAERAEEAPPLIQRSLADLSTLLPYLHTRIFYLFEGVPETSCDSVCIRTRSSQTGDENCTNVQIRRLHDPGENLHRFAVRSLLGDLGRRQSWVQQRTASGVAVSEERLMRNEGERLGCK